MDFLDLKFGYWWEWQNEIYKECYKNFIYNFLKFVVFYDNIFRDFIYEMLKVIKCLREVFC